MVKNLPVNGGDIRDAGSIPGSGRSPGGGHGNPLQYCLEDPVDGEPGGLQSKVHKQLDTTEATYLRAHTHTDTRTCLKAGREG